MTRLKQLEFLIFERGGVTGAVRRIVKRLRGLFSATVILLEMRRKYPLLIPGSMQIEGALAWMERCRKIECFRVTPWARIYKLAPQQLWLKFT